MGVRGRSGVAVALVLAAFSACSVVTDIAGLPSNQTPVLKGISVHLVPNPVPNGGTVQARAFGSDQLGKDFTLGAVTWSSTDPAIATVANSNATEIVVTTLAMGQTEIVATVGTIAGRTTLTVTANPINSFTLIPATVTLRVGQDSLLRPNLLDANGIPIPVEQLPPMQWISSVPTVASVNCCGTVHATGVGTATITASSSGKSASAVVTVTP